MTTTTAKQREYYSQIITLAEHAGDTELVSHMARRLADLVEARNGLPPITKALRAATDKEIMQWSKEYETAPAEKPTRKKRHLSAAAREKIAEAQRLRWRKVHAGLGKVKNRR